MKSTILSVTQLNTYIKSIIDGDMLLRSLYVVGEISNFTNHYRTGHFYLTLKDESCAVKAVMFASANRRLKFMPENGMKVIVRGRVSVFERDGQYQLYIDDMQPDGLGALNLAFEQLKNKLKAEGMFDEELKKPLPSYPRTIGVVTSQSGAVLHDIRKVAKRRNPAVRIVLFPVQVQGKGAAAEIAAGITFFNVYYPVDVIIEGRGGGSAEDLWAFNEEAVVRAIAASDIPVISAVGHETDFTLSDFAADVRAATPSQAAELAIPDMSGQPEHVKELRIRLDNAADRIISDKRDRFMKLMDSRLFRNPASYLEEKQQRLDLAMSRLDSAASRILSEKRGKAEMLIQKLSVLDPLAVLQRGYGFATDSNGKIVSSVNDTRKGRLLYVQLADGLLRTKVEDIKGGDEL